MNAMNLTHRGTTITARGRRADPRRITVSLMLLLAGAAIHDLATSGTAREAFAAYALTH